MSNELTYGMKTMRITQNYNGKASHYPYSSGNPKGYPIDDAGKDTGKDWWYCGADKLEVFRITGVGTSYTNTLFLQSTKKVKFSDGSKNYVSIILVHPNDSAFKGIRKGTIFTRGEKIITEGTDGRASGNHLHIEVGKGKFKGNGWRQNSKGKWVVYSTGGPIKPEKAFYVLNKFTTIKSAGGLIWKKINSVNSSAKATTLKVPTITITTKTKNKTQIKRMQRCLNKILGTNLAIDGLNGKKTQEALTKFQRKYGLEVDKKCGPKTRKMMKKLLAA